MLVGIFIVRVACAVSAIMKIAIVRDDSKRMRGKRTHAYKHSWRRDEVGRNDYRDFAYNKPANVRLRAAIVGIYGVFQGSLTTVQLEINHTCSDFIFIMIDRTVLGSRSVS
ncbi:hypothetical protein EVAR_96307_1 [Eumeta japonica]|uniref:Uncharacterized protein n=1 Tax=Eumeta variegata TaxID=151549 RepID=A0A4C1VV67_EUMVA|nr:hypothetical protein EVAR_96307_1 [Eumeta japonica]